MAESAPDSLVSGVLRARSSEVADAIGRMEDVRPAALDAQRALLRELERGAPSAHTVAGLTGPPGVGKSTLAGALMRHWLDAGVRVGMLAIDPSSRRSGGALLGDRARVQLRPDEPAFFRSMAAGEQLGGLAPAARAATAVLRAAYPRVLVETVGVGQSEVDVADLADTVVVVLQPGSGDTLQFMKAGLLEIPDVLVVHKWDLGEPAERTRADLEAMLEVLCAGQKGWRPAVVGASALTGEGVLDVIAALDAHRAHLDASGELARRRSRARALWALELFSRRYGSLGIERLGGRDAALRLASEPDGTALDAFSDLASRAGLETPRD